jgi:hypothetical protein
MLRSGFQAKEKRSAVESRLDRRSFIATAAAFTVGSLSGMDKGGDVAERAAVGSGLQAQRLAWAGVRLQLEKATLFLDPLLNPDVWGPALKDKFIPVEPLEGDRYVVVTHRHPDHFDPQAVRKILGEEGIMVCDPDVAPLAASYGFKVRVATHYEPILLGDFTVTAVPAVDGYGDPQLSWVVFGGSRRIILCGDTIWHAHGGASAANWDLLTQHFFLSTERDSSGVNRRVTFRQ